MFHFGCGRIKRLQPWVGDEAFMLTYGDGVADIDVRKLVAFHREHRKLATITAVRPTRLTSIAILPLLLNVGRPDVRV